MCWQHSKYFSNPGKNPMWWVCYYPHFTDEDTEELCEQVTHLVSGRWDPESSLLPRALHCLSQRTGSEEVGPQQGMNGSQWRGMHPIRGRSMLGAHSLCVCLDMRTTSTGGVLRAKVRLA